MTTERQMGARQRAPAASRGSFQLPPLVLCGSGQQHPLRAPQRVQRIAFEIVRLLQAVVFGQPIEHLAPRGSVIHGFTSLLRTAYRTSAALLERLSLSLMSRRCESTVLVLTLRSLPICLFE